MKTILNMTAWSLAVTAVVWLTTTPQAAGIWDNPLAFIGLGLVGLGLCKHARDRTAAGAG